MKITIIGAGNMGGAIACGLTSGNIIKTSDVTVIDHRGNNVTRLKEFDSKINIVIADYSSLETADIVILAVKPWKIEEVIKEHKSKMIKSKQKLVSVAASIKLGDLSAWIGDNRPVYRVIPNTAVSVKESMTFFASANANSEDNQQVEAIFNELGKAIQIEEKQMVSGTALASCGIAFAFRYIRASMEGGVQMGFPAQMSKEVVLQTLKGAVELLERTDSHPEVEIDKVTTAGGITIKGLNEMEHTGFTSAVIKGLLASNVE